jgi:hypothetical protein
MRYVLSADEKPGVQARRRIHPARPPGPAARCGVENEYARCGTLAYLAAYGVHRGKVMARCEPTTGIKPFTALVDQVMNAEPYASARRVFWVVDDGASHRGDSGRPDERRLAERGHGAPAGARLLTQPNRDLLFDHPAQAAGP